MSEVEHKRPGQIILGWWSHNIGDRDSSQARALAARLRRAGLVETLGEAEVHGLAKSLQITEAEPLVRLVQVLAEVRDHVAQTLAQRLGGETPALSTLRFQRLMRVENDDLPAALRRAVVIADRKCNVAALGQDVMHWSDKTRSRWCFHYYGAAAPDALKDSANPIDEEISQ